MLLMRMIMTMTSVMTEPLSCALYRPLFSIVPVQILLGVVWTWKQIVAKKTGLNQVYLLARVSLIRPSITPLFVPHLPKSTARSHHKNITEGKPMTISKQSTFDWFAFPTVEDSPAVALVFHQREIF